MGLLEFRTPTRLLALLACAWLVTPLAARADTRALDVRTLGITESVLQYCGPLDPAAAAKLKVKIKHLVKGVSEQQLTQARGSSEYRKAYDSVTNFVSKIDERNAKRICYETPAASK